MAMFVVYSALLDDVFSLEYMIDDLVRADVSGCCEDDSWFPFERLISVRGLALYGCRRVKP